MTDEQREITLRSPDGSQTVQASDPDEVAQYERNGYERVDSGQE